MGDDEVMGVGAKHVRSTKIHPMAVEAAIIDVCDSALNYQIVLNQEGDIDTLKLIIETPEEIITNQTLRVILSERICNLHKDLSSLITAGFVMPPDVEFVPK